MKCHIRNLRILFFSILFLRAFSLNAQTNQQNKKMCFGAYYFDGWSGAYPYHLTPFLKNDFKEREPVWGWQANSQEKMNLEIKYAQEAGLSFFNFCWYYNGKPNFVDEPLNHALILFKNSNNSDFKFCLMVANHSGYEIHPADWPMVCKEWVKNFKEKNYLLAEEKPLIIFFSVPNLIKDFGGESNVKDALDSLRALAISNGLKGVSVGACVGPGPKEVKQAEACGFDILTGYNYHPVGFARTVYTNPLDSMRSAEKIAWNKFPLLSKLKYIPVSTLNWDPRPWARTKDLFSTTKHFIGFSGKSVEKSVSLCRKWINENPEYTTSDRIGLLYAWNEYGEGGYLTPTKTDGNSLLEGVKKALKK